MRQESGIGWESPIVLNAQKELCGRILKLAFEEISHPHRG
jgi:hypothetical protein